MIQDQTKKPDNILLIIMITKTGTKVMAQVDAIRLAQIKAADIMQIPVRIEKK